MCVKVILNLKSILLNLNSFVSPVLSFLQTHVRNSLINERQELANAQAAKEHEVDQEIVKIYEADENATPSERRKKRRLIDLTDDNKVPGVVEDDDKMNEAVPINNNLNINAVVAPQADADPFDLVDAFNILRL